VGDYSLHPEAVGAAYVDIDAFDRIFSVEPVSAALRSVGFGSGLDRSDAAGWLLRVSSLFDALHAVGEVVPGAGPAVSDVLDAIGYESPAGYEPGADEIADALAERLVTSCETAAGRAALIEGLEAVLAPAREMQAVVA
jgi:hypothetical protein